MAGRFSQSLDSSALPEELRSIEFRRACLPDINEISATLKAKKRELRLNRPPMTHLKRIEKGLIPVNWRASTTELKDLIDPVKVAKASRKSTFEGICPSQGSPYRSSVRRHLSLEENPEYLPPIRHYNYKLDSTVQYREALLRVSGMTKLNRK
jgi:hypothetical protein